MAYLFNRDHLRQTLQLALFKCADAQNEGLGLYLCQLAEKCPLLMHSFFLHREEGKLDDDFHGSNVNVFGNENHLDQVLHDLDIAIHHHTPTVAYSASFWAKLHHACGTGDLRRIEMYAGIRFSDVYVLVHHVK